MNTKRVVEFGRLSLRVDVIPRRWTLFRTGTEADLFEQIMNVCKFGLQSITVLFENRHRSRIDDASKVHADAPKAHPVPAWDNATSVYGQIISERAESPNYFG
jgi:hypothetical protein